VLTVIKKNPVKILGLLAVCLLFGLAMVVVIARRQGTVATPKIVENVNPDEIRAQAERGNADAQKRLGAIYARGQGVKQDYAQAAHWYRRAADQGHAGAQAALGELYEAGQGVTRDDAEAAQWYRRAAEQGHAPAQYNLAILYVMGKGVPHDNAEALKWYRQAADHGDALAQYNLGMRYYEGNAVAPDPVEAYQWLSLAAAQGMPDAAKARDEVKRRMTREQIAEGRRRTDAFAAKTPAARSP
jgi:TPR repeat protein